MLEICPMTLKEANAYVEQYHRHHKPVVGHKFRLAALTEIKSWAWPLSADLSLATLMTGGRWRLTAFARMGRGTPALCCTPLRGGLLVRWAISGS